MSFEHVADCSYISCLQAVDVFMFFLGAYLLDNVYVSYFLHACCWLLPVCHVFLLLMFHKVFLSTCSGVFMCFLSACCSCGFMCPLSVYVFHFQCLSCGHAVGLLYIPSLTAANLFLCFLCSCCWYFHLSPACLLFGSRWLFLWACFCICSCLEAGVCSTCVLPVCCG